MVTADGLRRDAIRDGASIREYLASVHATVTADGLRRGAVRAMLYTVP